MNRNQKIALGCGGAGCLGLIVIAIAVVGFFVWQRTYSTAGVHSSNSNTGSIANANSDSNSHRSVETSESSPEPKTGNSNNAGRTTTSSKSSLSDDDKHRLFYAASISGDPDLVHRVGIKIGIMDEDFEPKDDYVSFLKEHVAWSIRNTEFIQSVSTPEEGKAYVEKHLGQ